LKSMRHFYVLTFLAFFTFFVPASAGTIYVKPFGTAGNTGVDWANAKDLALALSTASDDDELWLMSGNYLPGTLRSDSFSITSTSNISLFGGFNGTETMVEQRNWVDFHTIITGDIGSPGLDTDNSYRIFDVTSSENVRFDGLIVEKAYPDGTNPDDRGGAFAFATSTFFIENCVLRENKGEASGSVAAAILTDSNPGTQSYVKNSVIVDNSSRAHSGAIFLDLPTVFENVVFANNHAATQGGAWNGGAIYIGSSATPTDFIHCTFYNNSTDTSGGAIYSNTATTLIANSVFWDNVAPTSGDDVLGSASVTVSNTAKSNAGSLSGITDGGNIIVFDGAFADNVNLEGPDGKWFTPDDGLALSANSNAIDAGANANNPGIDITGLDRNDGAVDLGAYESGPFTPNSIPGLVLWLKDPDTNFNGTTWLDSSGLGNDAVPVGSKPFLDSNYPAVTYISPTLVTESPGSGPWAGNMIPALFFDETADDQLVSDNLNSDTGLSETTIFIVMRTAGTSPAASKGIVGFGSRTDNQALGTGFFSAAPDGSMRYDDGNNAGSAIPTHLHTRAVRLNNGEVTSWTNGGGGLTTNVAPTSTPSGGTIPNPTSEDDFYLGDIHNGATNILEDSSVYDAYVVSVIAYNTALSDSEVTQVSEYLTQELVNTTSSGPDLLVDPTFPVPPNFATDSYQSATAFYLETEMSGYNGNLIRIEYELEGADANNDFINYTLFNGMAGSNLIADGDASTGNVIAGNIVFDNIWFELTSAQNGLIGLFVNTPSNFVSDNVQFIVRPENISVEYKSVGGTPIFGGVAQFPAGNVGGNNLTISDNVGFVIPNNLLAGSVNVDLLNFNIINTSGANENLQTLELAVNSGNAEDIVDMVLFQGFADVNASNGGVFNVNGAGNLEINFGTPLSFGPGSNLNFTLKVSVDDPTDLALIDLSLVPNQSFAGGGNTIGGNAINTGSINLNPSDSVSPTLGAWNLDLNAETLTMIFDEAVDVTTLNPPGIAIQDAPTAGTSYVLTDSFTSSSNGSTIVIDLSTTDMTGILGDSGLATAQGDSYLVILSSVINDLAGNPVNTISDGSAVNASSYTPAPTPILVSTGFSTPSNIATDQNDVVLMEFELDTTSNGASGCVQNLTIDVLSGNALTDVVVLYLYDVGLTSTVPTSATPVAGNLVFGSMDYPYSGGSNTTFALMGNMASSYVGDNLQFEVTPENIIVNSLVVTGAPVNSGTIALDVSGPPPAMIDDIGFNVTDNLLISDGPEPVLVWFMDTQNTGYSGNISEIVFDVFGSDPSVELAGALVYDLTGTTLVSNSPTLGSDNIVFSGLDYSITPGGGNVHLELKVTTNASFTGDNIQFDLQPSGIKMLDSAVVTGTPISSGTIGLDNTPPGPGTVYVMPTAMGAGDGSDWANAANLHDALASAVSGDNLWLASGNYIPGALETDTFFIDVDNVSLFGGFNGTETMETQRDWVLHPTSISGEIQDDANLNNNTDQLLKLSGNSIVLSGLIIEGANGSARGAGLQGFGIFDLTIEDCIFRNNTADEGGAYEISSVVGGEIYISNSIFINNHANYGGGGKLFGSEEWKVFNCIFIQNSASIGGAGLIVQGSGAIYGSTFYQNQDSDGPGGNNAGQLAFNSSGDGVSVKNSLFFEADNTSNLSAWDGTNATVQYSHFDDGTVGQIGTGNPGGVSMSTGTVTTESPAFSDNVNFEGADMMFFTPDDGLVLTSSANAIDSGTQNSPFTDFDILGEARDATPDLGAYQFTLPPQTPSIVYVRPTPIGAGDGSDWANAANLLDGVAMAGYGDEIWVATGNYRASPTENVLDAFDFNQSNVSIFGGFSGNESMLEERDWVLNPTVIDGDIGTPDFHGDNSETLFVLGAANLHIDGFIFERGQADVGSGTGLYAGAIYCSSSAVDIVIANSVFRNNYAGHGGAIAQPNAVTSGLLTVHNCVFEYNRGTNSSGAIYSKGWTKISNSVFAFNTVDTNQGGAVTLNAGNTAHIEHSVFYGNDATGNGGAVWSDTTTTNLVNSIFWDNNSSSNFEIYQAGGTILTGNCIIQGADSGSWPGSFWGTNTGFNVDANPLFSDNLMVAGADNIWFTNDDGFTLQAGSPAIDHGVYVASVNIGILGMARDNIPNAGPYQTPEFTPPPPDLMGYWPLNDGTGTTPVDISTVTNHASFVNGTPTWTTGLGGNGALTFDGSTGFLSIPDQADYDNVTQFTVTAWVNPSNFPGNMSILSKDSPTPNQRMLYFGLNSSGNLHLFGSSDGTNPSFNLFSVSSVPTSTWTHVAATWDGSDIKVYINGILDGSLSYTGSLHESLAGIQIGGKYLNFSSSPTYFFDGSIMEVRLYRRGLSPTEVNQIYDEMAPFENIVDFDTNKQTPGDGAAQDYFGTSIALQGNVAIIGAHGDDDQGTDSGAAYVYVSHDGNTWVEHSKLVASDPASLFWFGITADISDNVAIISRMRDNGNASNSGSAYIFAENGSGSWIEQDKLIPSDGAVADNAGRVAISGNVAVLGSEKHDAGGTDAGAVWVFTNNGGSEWIEQTKLMSSDIEAGDKFGFRSEISDNVMFITQLEDDDDGTDAGAVWVFVNHGNGAWVEHQKLRASDGSNGARFGFSLSAEGNILVVGAIQDVNTSSGKAYVFRDNGTGNWVEEAQLVAPDAETGDSYGSDVVISGNLILMGGRLEDDNGSDAGAAYVFADVGGGNWVPQTKIVAFDGAADDKFGNYVALSGNTALIGSSTDDDNGTDSGSAYFIQLDIENEVGPIVPQQELIVHLEFEEGTGATTVDSASGITASVNNSPSWVSGPSGNYAILFDGLNDEVVIDKSNPEVNDMWHGPATVAMWVQVDSFTSTQTPRLLSKRFPDTNGWELIPWGDSNYYYHFSHPFTTTNGGWHTPVSSLQLGELIHLTITYDASSDSNDPAIYINGSPVTVTEQTTPVGTPESDVNNQFYIGHNAQQNRPMNGLVDDLQIYNTILSSQEVMEVYVESSNAILASEDFETYAPGTPVSPWLFNPAMGDVGVVEISSAQAFSGSQSIEIEGTSGNGQGIYLENSYQAEDMVIEFEYFMPAGYSDGSNQGYVQYGGGIVRPRPVAGGTFILEEADTTVLLSELPEGTWVHMTLKVDYDNSLMEISAGGNSAVFAYTKDESGLWESALSLFGKNSGLDNRVYFDDIHVMKENVDLVPPSTDLTLQQGSFVTPGAISYLSTNVKVLDFNLYNPAAETRQFDFLEFEILEGDSSFITDARLFTSSSDLNQLNSGVFAINGAGNLTLSFGTPISLTSGENVTFELHMTAPDLSGIDSNGGLRSPNVPSGTRSGRNLTSITYDYQGSQFTFNAADAIGSNLILSTLTAGAGSDANRFWDATETTLTEQDALRSLGDLDLGSGLQACATPVGEQHDVMFDTPITPGSGPEIFIIHGSMNGPIHILDPAGNVALTVPDDSGSTLVIAGGTAFATSFNGLFLRDNVTFQVELSGTHGGSPNRIFPIDVNPDEVPLIGGVRFGAPGCDYLFEILGRQPAPTSTNLSLALSPQDVGSGTGNIIVGSTVSTGSFILIPPPSLVVTETASDFIAGGNTTLTIELQDGLGNPISSDNSTQVTFDPGGTIGSTQIDDVLIGTGDASYGIQGAPEVITLSNGQARIVLSGMNTETGNVVISNDNEYLDPPVQTFEVNFGSPDRVRIQSSPNDITTGANTYITYEVIDAFFNTIEDDNSTSLTITPSGNGRIVDILQGSGDGSYGTPGGSETITVQGGLVQVTLSSDTPETVNLSVTNDAAYPNPADDDFNVIVGAAYQVVVIQHTPDFSIGGNTLLEVEVQDAFGNRYPYNDEGNISFNPSGDGKILDLITGTGDGSYGQPAGFEQLQSSSGTLRVLISNDVAESFTIGVFNNGGLINPSPISYTAIDSSLPFQIAAAGRSTLYGIDNDGDLFTIGRNEEKQLGRGPMASGLGALNFPANFVSVSAGAEHAVAITSHGNVVTWGSSTYGQSQNGVDLVPQTLSDEVIKVAAGAQTTFAITADNRLWARGRNHKGQLGLGDVMNRSSWTEVSLPSGNITDVSAGIEHTLIIVDGDLLGFGSNGFAQLGNPDTSLFTSSIGVINDQKTWISVAAGGFHSLAIDDQQDLYGWGKNHMGQLGLGTTNLTPSPTRIEGGFQGNPVVAVAAGYEHSLFMVDSTSLSLHGMGSNRFGQLRLLAPLGSSISTPMNISGTYDHPWVGAGPYNSVFINFEVIRSWGILPNESPTQNPTIFLELDPLLQ